MKLVEIFDKIKLKFCEEVVLTRYAIANRAAAWGIIDDLGRYSAEAHVKDFMIRHQRILGLSDEDIDVLKKLMELGL